MSSAGAGSPGEGQAAGEDPGAGRPLPRYWDQLSTRDFDRLDRDRAIAVLPVAATEQHGPHLSLAVDRVLADGIVAASLPHLPADLPVLYLPTQAVGFSPEHDRFAGTLSLSSGTLIRLWTEIGESVARSGLRKLVLFNTHGGQVGALDLVARDLRARLDLLVYSASWFNLPLADASGADPAMAFGPEEARFGVHAGAVETSMMLALAPQQVRMALARDFDSSSRERARRFPILGNGRSARLAWQMQDLNVQGAAGDASAARADIGQALVQAAGRALASLLDEIDHLPPDTLVPQPAPGP
ncbi:MAG: creatininase family protein [Rhodoferax sp.]|nr:creatininase family protein [Rhodoferax sp.]